MQPQTKRNTAWGREPVGEWTDAETKAWEKEQQTSKEAPEDMDEGVHKAARGFRRDPETVSKKTEEAIKSTGVRPDKKLVTKLAAQVVAYRMESRGDKGILYDKGVSTAVRSMAGDYEAKH
jgi:hypothetical protein